MNPINNEIIFHVAIACLEMAEKVVLMDRRLEFEIWKRRLKLSNQVSDGLFIFPVPTVYPSKQPFLPSPDKR